jgi:hypothetical protein
MVLLTAVGCREKAKSTIERFTKKRPATLFVVFVDASQSRSPEDWSIYDETFTTLLTHVKPGDRIVVGPISASTLRTFRPSIDRTVAKTGIVLNDEEDLQRVEDDVRKSFVALRDARSENETHILEALDIAAQLHAADTKRPRCRVVILSDMLENSPEARFARAEITPSMTQSLIEKRRSHGALPNLSGIEVDVAGASAPNAEMFHAVREFWLSYFQAAGATCGPGCYVREGLQFGDTPER